eukprot:1157828-Pelagomonas_calceolata.AAC.3
MYIQQGGPWAPPPHPLQPPLVGHPHTYAAVPPQMGIPGAQIGPRVCLLDLLASADTVVMTGGCHAAEVASHPKPLHFAAPHGVEVAARHMGCDSKCGRPEVASGECLRKQKSTPAKRLRAFRKGSLTSKLARVPPKGPQT